MTVARVAQDEVDAVRREMQDKLKAAQDCVERQVSGGNRGRGLDEQEKREAWFWGRTSILELRMKAKGC